MESKIKEITLFAMLGVLMFALKFAMASLPNIEPVTLLIMVYAHTFKNKAFYPVTIYVILEILVYGFGLWTIGYCYIWFILTAVSAWILPNIDNKWVTALIAENFGFLFGALYIPVYLIASGWESAFAWWITGIPYDALHGMGNAAMILLLYKPLTKVFKEMYERY